MLRFISSRSASDQSVARFYSDGDPLGPGAEDAVYKIRCKAARHQDTQPTKVAAAFYHTSSFFALISTMTTDIKGHIVTATLPSWGHTKPLLALLARLIRIRPIHATVLIGEPLYPRVIGEIDRHFTEEEKDLKKLIRYHFALPSRELEGFR